MPAATNSAYPVTWHLVEDLTLLALTHVCIARRQRAYQVVPTHSLHLTDLTVGRILI
jgi:hypothetical protein